MQVDMLLYFYSELSSHNQTLADQLVTTLYDNEVHRERERDREAGEGSAVRLR